MGEVAGSVALATAGVPPVTPAPASTAAAAPAQAPSAPAPAAPAAISFADDGPADRAAQILDEVLAGGADETAGSDDQVAAETEAESVAAPAEGGAQPGDKPAAPAEPAKDAPPSNDIEAAKLRKGFAKLADEKQKAIELQNQARAEIARAQSFAPKAQKYDELVAKLEADPAGFILAHGGEGLVQKALQGFIDQEKSPAEREVAKLRKENDEREHQRAQRETEQTARAWREGVVAKVQGDERFDLVNSLGLHGDVIDVMTRYYEVHSKRDDKGNVVEPAILPWDTAAQAVEDQRAAMIEKSKRYGKRMPAATTPATPAPKKDAPSAKQQLASAKKAPTSLSSVPVAESPAPSDDELSMDPDERERQLLAQLGV